jgi:hypothetical protein
MKHQYYDTIVAWASGKIVQHRSAHSNVTYQDEWIDYVSDDFHKFISNFNTENLEWRIKPEIKMRKYRVAQFKDPCGFSFTETTDDYNNDDDLENSEGFVNWLTDWIEYEVEE